MIKKIAKSIADFIVFSLLFWVSFLIFCFYFKGDGQVFRYDTPIEFAVNGIALWLSGFMATRINFMPPPSNH